MDDWVKYDPHKDNITEYYYGFHPVWIDADWCAQGIREIVYEGDHYVSCYWDSCHEVWRSTSTSLDDNPVKPIQPLYVMTRFPVDPPRMFEEVL